MDAPLFSVAEDDDDVAASSEIVQQRPRVWRRIPCAGVWKLCALLLLLVAPISVGVYVLYDRHIVTGIASVWHTFVGSSVTPAQLLSLLFPMKVHYMYFLLKVDYDAYLAVLPACNVDVVPPTGISTLKLRAGSELACAQQDDTIAAPPPCFCLIRSGLGGYGGGGQLLRLCNPVPVICTPPFANMTVFFGDSYQQMLTPAELVLKNGCEQKSLVHLRGQEAARAFVALQILQRNRTVHIPTY